jgi:hypothetical protein
MPSIAVALASCGARTAALLVPLLLDLLLDQQLRTWAYLDDSGYRAVHRCPSVAASPLLHVVNASSLSAGEMAAGLQANGAGQRFACGGFKSQIGAGLKPTHREADVAIVVDVDTMPLEPLSAMPALGSVAVFAMARECEGSCGWYYTTSVSTSTYVPPSGIIHKSVPNITFVPPSGLNSGVLLVNLAKRSTLPGDIFAPYREASTSEGNAFNRWAADHQDGVQVLPCKWNRRPDSRCAALDGGVLHGSRMFFDSPDLERRWAKKHPTEHGQEYSPMMYRDAHRARLKRQEGLCGGHEGAV